MLLTAVNTGTLVSNESDLSGEKGTMLLSLVELLNIVDICQRISLFRMNWMIHREVNPVFFRVLSYTSRYCSLFRSNVNRQPDRTIQPN